MAKKKRGLNKHQKAAFRTGERRVRGPEIEHYLELSQSPDPADRAVAAKNLCPCHVRRRIDAVWEALYRMLEDPDVKVRRAAWHTLEDGGRPDDPALDDILDRAIETETDPQVRRFIALFSGIRKQQADIALELAARPEFDRRGKCDFCGRPNIPVKQDFDTRIPGAGLDRLALICESCAKTLA